MRDLLVSIFLCMSLPALVVAQTSGNSGLDLPLSPARLGDQFPAITIEHVLDDDDDGDDPGDTPPPTFYGEEIDTESDSIFYVVDTSCSMNWDMGNYISVDGKASYGSRMDRAKAEVIRSINGLSENFEFNIISYNCSTAQWSRTMREATDPNKLAASTWISALIASGATGTGPAVAQALTNRDNLTVILLTDGAPNCGVMVLMIAGLEDQVLSAHRSLIRDANLQRAAINVFGLSASGIHRSFCQGVARDSGGMYIDLP